MLHKIDIKIDVQKLEENPVLPEILQILKTIRPAWSPESVCSKVFTGGISNVLYGYYEDGRFSEDVVLFRIEGEGTELMIDRKQERENIQVLHAAGCCPPLYAVYNNGIAYGFVNGETLDENTVRDPTIRKLIAKEMVRMHSIHPDSQVPVAGLWKKLSQFLELSPSGFPDNPDKHKQYESTICPKHVLEQELCKLRDHLEALNSPVVFCHNDLLLKNIIYNEGKGSVHFIDHEYAMYNYEHFEIGNHFCEYAGVDDVDFSRYPDKTYQLDWIRYYLECQAEHNGGAVSDITDRDVEDCYVKANKFALAAHFFWGLWGLVQARFSKLDFDFLDYASLKLGEYFTRKDEFFALQVPAN